MGKLLGLGPPWPRPLITIRWKRELTSGHFLLIHFGISWAAPGGGSGLSAPACRLSTFKNLNLLTNEEVECYKENRRLWGGAPPEILGWDYGTG